MLKKYFPYTLFFILLFIGHIVYVHSDLAKAMNTNNFTIHKQISNKKSNQIKSMSSGVSNIK